MPKSEVYTDEAILTALCTENTVDGAARALGCSRRLIYQRMQQSRFRACLTAFRAERVRAAAALLDGAAMAAAQALVEIVSDKNADPGDRVRAARCILEHAPKYQDRLGDLEFIPVQAAENVMLDDVTTVDVFANLEEKPL